MTREEVIEIFESDRQTNWLLNDLAGFVRLVQLGYSNPGSEVQGQISQRDLVSCAEHDQIWLDIDIDWLASVATKEDIEYLSDCGFNWDDDVDSVFMFV